MDKSKALTGKSETTWEIVKALGLDSHRVTDLEFKISASDFVRVKVDLLMTEEHSRALIPIPKRYKLVELDDGELAAAA